MKLRKGILSILIISLMIMIIGISTKVKAEMVNPKKIATIKNMHTVY